jgi:hypothetical protein
MYRDPKPWAYVRLQPAPAAQHSRSAAIASLIPLLDGSFGRRATWALARRAEAGWRSPVL